MGRKEGSDPFRLWGEGLAHNAAFVNSVMARTLDYCDGMVPGMHFGLTCVLAAFATSELSGGCSGKDLLTYLVFMRFPTCWATASSIDAILALANEKLLTGEEIDRMDAKISPYPRSLVGHTFRLGDNPRECAQYSTRYCVVSAPL
jgi:2-methylcitrate dehydratase PrpD